MRRVVGIVIVLLGLIPSVASAATITVQGTTDLTGSFDDDNICSLRDAISAANTNAPFSECPGDNGGGTGIDTILLEGGRTYTLTNHAAPEDGNASGDLDISGGGGTIIRVTGSGLATIDAESAGAAPMANRGRVLDILNGAGAVTLERVRVTGGGVTDSTGGGGISTRAPLTLTDTEVVGNNVGVFGGGTGSGGGGIFVFNPGGLTMTRSTVAGNVVKANPGFSLDSARGGGISYFGTAPLTITNSTISGNTVDSSGNTGNTTYAGGLYWAGFGTTASLTNVTISANSAIGGDEPTVTAGGVMLFADNLTMKNTILAGNTAPDDVDCGQVNPTDDWISAGDNALGDTNSCGFTGSTNNLLNVFPPNLGALSNFGGLTRTMLPNPGSPVIDRGGTCPATDQRGFFRGPAAPCDIGAVEVGAPSTLPTGPSPPAAPDNDFSFGGIERNKTKGTALLTVVVPGAGDLVLEGNGLKPSTAAATGPGEVELKVKAAGKAKQKLRQKGKKKVKPSVTFTPTGGAPNTEGTSVKLVRR